MKSALTVLSLLFCIALFAQKREELFDYSFKPSKTSPYYFVETTKTDSGWLRRAYYVSQRTLAMQGLYKDDSCKVAHGFANWFHPTSFEQSRGRYVDGKKEGLWLGFNDKGLLIDSSMYSAGRRIGVAFRWYDSGFLRDSLNFDGKGNGIEASWYDDGSLASAGRWTQDTVKTGRWTHYHKSGKVLATEDFRDGKLVLCNCYDEAGTALDTALCREKEAEPGGGIRRWRLFLERGLQSLIERKANSREWLPGPRTVAIRFVVEKDGSLSEFLPFTNSGAEEEIIRLLKTAPRWKPGTRFGKPVRSYHTQPLTFMIQ